MREKRARGIIPQLGFRSPRLSVTGYRSLPTSSADLTFPYFSDSLNGVPAQRSGRGRPLQSAAAMVIVYTMQVANKSFSPLIAFSPYLLVPSMLIIRLPLYECGAANCLNSRKGAGVMRASIREETNNFTTDSRSFIDRACRAGPAAEAVIEVINGVPRADAPWIGNLLSCLSPEKIADAFRAAC